LQRELTEMRAEWNQADEKYDVCCVVQLCCVAWVVVTKVNIIGCRIISSRHERNNNNNNDCNKSHIKPTILGTSVGGR
jgi:hypothetical protein